MEFQIAALCAVIDGADDWLGAVKFVEANREWFSTSVKFPNKIALHDIFGRVFLGSQLPDAGESMH